MQQQFELFPEKPRRFSVMDLNSYLRALLEGDETLQDIWVNGEISNLSLPKSGHIYFTLKDSQAAVRCVMWRSQVTRLTSLPQDGMAVEVHGSISVYEASGQYQLYADTIRPAGEGYLYQEFLRLKASLEAEGLFDPSRKRQLPVLPSVIGIVTSPTGAAIRDILNTIGRRYPLAEVVLAPAAVQGEAAAPEIAAGIRQLNQQVHPDVIIIGRGGGSLEDLWAFNEELVARAVAASDAPVISAVGHETDFTISDFAADLRAPTPTAAAELATPDQQELRGLLLERRQAAAQAITDEIEELRWQVTQSGHRLERISPQAAVRSGQQSLDELIRRADRALDHQLQLGRAKLEGARQQLDALNPTGVLSRGYAIVTRGGIPVLRTDEVTSGDEIKIQVTDGAFGAEVIDKGDKNE
jgi:exodeoxyribonuclease VII large subunit